MDLIQIIVYLDLLIGVLVAALIYLDMRNAGKVEALWVVIGLILGLIGALLYFIAVKQKRKDDFSYPPSPKYEKPEYSRKEEKVEMKVEEVAEVPDAPKEQIDGIPRCPHCGAAISVHDWECEKCGAQLKGM